MIRRPPRSTPKPSSAASDVYKRQHYRHSSASTKLAAEHEASAASDACTMHGNPEAEDSLMEASDAAEAYLEASQCGSAQGLRNPPGEGQLGMLMMDPSVESTLMSSCHGGMSPAQVPPAPLSPRATELMGTEVQQGRSHSAADGETGIQVDQCAHALPVASQKHPKSSCQPTVFQLMLACAAYIMRRCAPLSVIEPHV